MAIRLILKESRNLKLPMNEFNQWWEENQNAFENTYRLSFAKKKDIIFSNKLEFINPYNFNPHHSGKSSIPQVITFKFVVNPENKRANAMFDYQNQIIEINTLSFDHWPHFKSLLIHELAHAIDPKNNQGDDIANSILDNDKDLFHSSQRFEFDAYCNQFISIMLERLSKKEILKLIETNPMNWKLNGYKLGNSFILNVQDFFSELSPSQKRKFHQRIYSAAMDEVI